MLLMSLPFATAEHRAAERERTGLPGPKVAERTGRAGCRRLLTLLLTLLDTRLELALQCTGMKAARRPRTDETASRARVDCS